MLAHSVASQANVRVWIPNSLTKARHSTLKIEFTRVYKNYELPVSGSSALFVLLEEPDVRLDLSVKNFKLKQKQQSCLRVDGYLQDKLYTLVCLQFTRPQTSIQKISSRSKFDQTAMYLSRRISVTSISSSSES